MPSPTTGAGPSMSVAALALSAPDRTAVVDASRRITWAELARLVSDRTASLLQPAPGRPAFLIPKPDLNGLVDILAHWEAHIPAVLVSPKLTSAEQDALKSHADSIAEPLPDGTAFVVFTSGTTGLPKPAILTRESLTAGARAMVRALRMTSSDVLQLSLSPARVGGLGIIMRTLAAGSTIALSPGFSGARFPEPLARDGVTFASLVPAMLADVLERNPDWRNPPHLRAILIGGATTSRAKISNVVIGTFLFQGVLTLGMPVANALVPQSTISETLRILISNGIILYALTKSGGANRG